MARAVVPKSSTTIIEAECLVCNTMQSIINSCPVEAVHAGSPYPFIDDTCVNCGLCVDMCPYDAIVESEDSI